MNKRCLFLLLATPLLLIGCASTGSGPGTASNGSGMGGAQIGVNKPADPDNPPVTLNGYVDTSVTEQSK